MKKLVGLVLLAALYYAHGYYVFSENHLNAWFAERNEALIQGKDGLCDVYSADVQFNLIQKTPDGELLKEGGYNKLCQSITGGDDKAMSIAALRATGANINIYTRVVSVEPSEFPWLQATVKVHQATRMTLGRTLPMAEEGDATLLIERTYQGLKIKRMTGTSELKIIEDEVTEPVEEATTEPPKK
jgi:hypothetical protein